MRARRSCTCEPCRALAVIDAKRPKGRRAALARAHSEHPSWRSERGSRASTRTQSLPPMLNPICDCAFQELPRRSLFRVILAAVHHGFFAVWKNDLAEAHDVRAAFREVADKCDLVTGLE